MSSICIRSVLRIAKLLRRVADQGLMHAIQASVFADVSRPPDGGRGFDGVFERAADYWNPFEEELSCHAEASA